MPKLPDDNTRAYEGVQDTLSATISVCVSILNEERNKESPDQTIIDKYKNILQKADDLMDDIPIENLQKMQEIRDNYSQFVRKHRGL